MFEDVKFNGVFRSYQQQILNHAGKYLEDGRINIVAAPGSGKTILGLELICRLNERALILSPTIIIRNQWGQRFKENFTGGSRSVSYDLRNPSDITSVTYQALYSAMMQKKDEEDDSDYTGFDIFSIMRQNGIRTICLDEAHHLQNEWQKSLETFIGSLADVKLISLTATPPYDASPADWERYVKLCGEIDEEIFVPELVKQGTLCPHQDYIYFNFPTREETNRFDEYRRKVSEALTELYAGNYVKLGYSRLLERRNDYNYLYENAKGAIAFLMLCEDAKLKVDRRLTKSLALRKPYLITLERLETGVNFLVKVLLKEDERADCLKLFKVRELYERGNVSLDLNERLRRRLLSSVGKLKSIQEIAVCESENMGKELRLLILTDYIKKESVSFIGSEQECDSVSVVSVYETVRRLGVSVGALSGGLVILPRSCSIQLEQYGAKFYMTDTADMQACVFSFEGNNREKVEYVSRLFEEGYINVLVGTKSLLGEGWDAPFVNALILASFVGSFVLSNQMRGRAIRTCSTDPQKTANIWHLVTVERPRLTAQKLKERYLPEMQEEACISQSYDFKMLSRRFECFAAPDYETGDIRSGIDRISNIRPPFGEEGIARINRDMLDMSSRRKEQLQIWRDGLDGTKAQLNKVSEIPKNDLGRAPFIFVNLLTAIIILSLMRGVLGIAINSITGVIDFYEPAGFWNVVGITVLVMLAAILMGYLGNIIFLKLLVWFSPKRTIKKFGDCILKTLQELLLISADVRLVVTSKDGLAVCAELINASVHDQNLFHDAIKDMFSPIRNPRYVCLPVVLGIKSYWRAMACPEILGAKKEYAEKLIHNLKRLTGKLCVVYTRTEKGRRLILKCRRRSYISKNYALINNTRQISRFE